LAKWLKGHCIAALALLLSPLAASAQQSPDTHTKPAAEAELNTGLLDDYIAALKLMQRMSASYATRP